MARLAELGSSLFASICILALILGIASTTPYAVAGEPLIPECVEYSAGCWNEEANACESSYCPGTGDACFCYQGPLDEDECLCIPTS